MAAMKRDATQLRLLLMGPPAVLRTDLPVRLETKKAMALLAYLSMRPGGVRRDSLAALFWPEYDHTNAFGNLRRTLASLNRSLPGGWLEADRETVSLKDSPKILVDARSFREGMSRCQTHCGGDRAPCAECMETLGKEAQLFRGDFLEGFNLPDCPEFDDWQLSQRESLRMELGRALERLVRGHARQCQWDPAIDHARRWVSLDRLHEPAERTLIELYARAGQKSAAIKQYESFAKLLDDELGARPEAQTVELYNATLDGRLAAEKAQHVRGAVPPPSPLEPFMRAKLFIPPARADTVQRSRLTTRIDRGIEKPLTLLCAPAGFGKTTLLACWVAKESQPVAWVSLDAGDNDPRLLMRAVILALNSVHSDVGEVPLEMLSSPQPVPVQAIMTVLLNEISRASRTVLVLDDLHVLTQPATQELTAFLVDHIPPTLHLVIATRSDPSLPLARLRARNWLAEFRAGDLRFTTGEAAEFLNGVAGLNVSAEQVATLETRTEGWIAGLQMAALSLQGRRDTAGFIEGFSGSNRFVLDYLTDEVLSRQPRDITLFLFRTSILERLCGPLCDAVAERVGDSSRVLEELEKANLFIVPLDDERKWYRYHHLFADLLRVRLSHSEPSRVPVLHVRASEWFERNGFWEEAMAHARSAKDHRRMIRLIEENAPSMVGAGRLTTIADWIETIPTELFQDKPQLFLLHAWGLVTRAQMQKAEPLLDEAEKRIPQGGQDPETRNLRGSIAGLRAQIAETRGDVKSAIKLTRVALEDLAPPSQAARVSASYALGRAYFTTGDFTRARKVLSELVGSGRQIRTLFLYCPCTGLLAGMLRMEGKLREAELLYGEVIRVMQERGVQRFFIGGNTYIGIGSILRERNQLDEAERFVTEGIQHNRQWGNLNAIAIGLSVRARILIAQGRLDETSDVLSEEEDLIREFESYSDVRSNFKVALIELHLARGDPQAALRAAQDDLLEGTGDQILWREQDQISLSRALIANGRSGEALDRLGVLADASEAAGRFGRLLEILNLQAIALHASGKTAQARRCLGKSLSLAGQEGFMRVFLDEGELMQALLGEMEKNAPEDRLEYVNRLLVAHRAR